MSPAHSTVTHPVYGYRHLDPLPEASELSAFYESHYYHLIAKGGRAPELRRMLEGGETAEREREWLRHTLYSDIADTVGARIPGARILDVGCGTGELVSYLSGAGFNATGIDPSVEAVAIGCEAGLYLKTATLDDYLSEHGEPSQDVVVLLNVLEHVPDPEAIVRSARRVLVDGGMLCIRVPNDFNALQLAAQRVNESDPWWVAYPDHINYFDFESLTRLVEANGFRVADTLTDFPVELFLLMGDDYANDSSLGELCHQRRVRLETDLDAPTRRKIYAAFAAAGVGRNCLIFAEATE